VPKDSGWGAAKRLKLWLAATGNAATYADLVARFGEPALRTALATGSVARVLPGVYAAAELCSDPLVRCKALVAWSAPDGFITGLAAAHMWGIGEEMPSVITVHVQPSWHLRAPPWARLLRAQTQPVTLFRIRGVRVADAPDAVIQAWREARPDIAAATVIEAVHGGLGTVTSLTEAIARRSQLPRRGRLVELIALLDGGVTSYLEYIARRDAFPGRLFPELQWQVEIWPAGRKRVMDAFDAEAMIDLEFDGFGSHGGAEAFETDRERDNEMRAVGIEPLHYTYNDVTKRPEWCRQNYRTVRATRLRQLGTGRT